MRRFLATALIVLCFSLHPPVFGETSPEMQEEESATAARLAELEQQVRELQQQIEELKEELGRRAPAAEEGYVGEEPGYEAPPPPRAAERVQKELPDISVVGEVRGNWSSDPSDPDRRKVKLYHTELALQSYLYPNVRGDVILGVARAADEFDVHVEEGFVNFLDIGGGFGLLAGRKFLPFGKANQLHDHHRLYSDTPLPLEEFFGERLVGDGAMVSYLVPGRHFLRLEVGSWRAAAHTHEAHEHEEEGNHAEEGIGLVGTVQTARLWTSRPVGEVGELELGLSHAWASDARATGLDLTYRRWPSAYRRLTLQGEYLRGGRADIVGRVSGFYLLANQRLDKYWDVGLRYDRSDSPDPGEGYGSAIVGFLTRHLTETTWVRLQYKRSRLPGGEVVGEPMVVVNFGMGPHAHPLE